MGKQQEVSTIAARVLDTLPAVTRAIAAEVRRAGVAYQLTMPQFSTLRLLAERDLSVSEIAKTLHVAMPTVTQSTDSLVGKGLAERVADDRDRRQVRLHSTPLGKQLLLECRRSVERYLEGFLSSWPPFRQEKLAAGLEALAKLVEEGALVRQA